MFIVSLKTSKKKIIAYTFVILIFGLGIFAYFATHTTEDINTGSKAEVTLLSNKDRIEYLKTCGWTVSGEALEICEVAIPMEFNDVYEVYNKLQKTQGFNLEEYRGKRAKRFTYEVTNYPNQVSDVRVNLLVYNDKIIAGDVCSLKLDGFMHTLKL